MRLALAVKPLLEARGIGVVMTRENDKAVTIADRCALANREGCAYFLSLHRDAAGPNAHGISMWIHSRADAPTTAKARGILDELLAVTPTNNRGVRKGTPQAYENFGVNVQTTMASALLELGFVTNEDDNARFDRHFEEYAEAVVRGICKAVGVAYADKPAETPKEEMMTVSRAKWEAVRAALQAAQKALNEVV